jgi:hypothetical protein
MEFLIDVLTTIVVAQYPYEIYKPMIIDSVE